MKNIYFIILSIIVMVYIINCVRKNELSIKNSFWWIIICIIMLILSIFPYSLDWLARLIGVDYPPALFLTLCVVVLLIQNFQTAKKIGTQNEKIIELEQHLAILESENRDEKKQKN